MPDGLPILRKRGAFCAPREATMNQSDDDRLVPFGDMPVFFGMWSLVALVVLTTAACM